MTVRTLSLLSALILSAIRLWAITSITDKTDNSPLPGASIFSASNDIVCITDSAGQFGDIDTTLYPLTVRYLGFETTTIDEPVATVALTPSALPLSEVTVTDRADGVRLVCYVRKLVSLSTSDRDHTVIEENMVEYILPVREKVKKFKNRKSPLTLNTRSIERIVRAGRPDSIVTDHSNIPPFASIMTDINGDDIDEPDAIASATSGTATRDKGKKTVFRKSRDKVIVSCDMLSDKKDHKWSPNFLKLLGLTTDFSELSLTRIYPTATTGRHPIYTLQSQSMAIGAVGRGKWIRREFKTQEPVAIRILAEIYPVDYQFITAEESRQLDKNKTADKIEFTIPSAAEPWPSLQ